MSVSIIHNSSLKYPEISNSNFSPSIQHPEYVHDDYSVKENLVYESVRNLLRDSGLDINSFGNANWNPLKEYINPGNKVFILCNFVTHKRQNENEDDFFSKVTHPSIIRAICDYIIIALKGNGEILIGNSPLQSADFNLLKESLGLNQIENFYAKTTKIKVNFVDLRGYITRLGKSGKITILKNDIDSVGFNVDFSNYSLLKHIRGNNKFRITNYNYKNITNLHNRSKHIYCLNKQILSSDVVFSIPKLKVHEKVGVTLGVKGFVGSVASKESLCHHQFGPPCFGGDEYPDCNPLKLAYSFLHDISYSNRIPILKSLLQIIDRNLTRIFNRTGNKITAGAWFGNETAWRMSFDLAKILHYVDKDGVIHDQIIRKNIVLIDGIIGGEGQGPLKPKPVESKTLIFSDNIVQGDYIGAIIMGYTPEKFKIINEFFCDNSIFKLVGDKPYIISYNGQKVDLVSLKKLFHYTYKAPIGWQKILL